MIDWLAKSGAPKLLINSEESQLQRNLFCNIFAYVYPETVKGAAILKDVLATEFVDSNLRVHLRRGCVPP